jgi:hypothetical protein
LLIDLTHKKWIVGAAVLAIGAIAVHAFVTWNSPARITGGSTIGLWYGVIGSALMIFAGLLSALRKVPSWWWIGSRQAWLRGHIWLGLLSAVFIMCHSGYHWGGLLEKALWVVLIAILITGIYGLIIQQFLPRLMARRIPCEAPYEQIPHLCRVLNGRAEELIEALELWPLGSPAENVAGGEIRSELRRFQEDVLRPFFETAPKSSPLAGDFNAATVFANLRSRVGLRAVEDHGAAADALLESARAEVSSLPEPKDLGVRLEGAFKKVRDNLLAAPQAAEPAATAKKIFAELPALPAESRVEGIVLELKRVCQDRWLTEIEALCQERRHYAEQERIHHWLHGWLLLHIPLSAALLVLGTLHAIVSLYY